MSLAVGFFAKISQAFSRSHETKASTGIPLASPDILGIFGVTPSASGVAVDAMAALRVPAIQNGVRVIAEAVGQLDLQLFRDDGTGPKRVEPKDHPVARVLERPNPFTGAFEFQRQLAADMLLWGNGLALIVRVRDEVRELYRIDPRSCTIEIDQVTGEPKYIVSMHPGGTQTYSYRDVIHLRNLTLDGFRGLGLVNLAQETIGLSTVLQRHAAKLFGRGARPSGVLEYAKTLSEQVAKKLKAQFEGQHGGAENSGGTLVLEDGMSFKPLTFSSTDAQFIEMRRFEVLEAARLLKLPPHLLADMQFSAGRANVEDLGMQFLSGVLSPILELYEDAIERTLLTDEERDSYCVEFDESDLIRADTEKRFAAYKTGTETGVYTINEARAKEGLPPIEGGDTPMRSVQSQPLGAASPEPSPTVPPANDRRAA